MVELQLSEQTIFVLEKLKKYLDVSSFDEAITIVALKSMKPKESMACSLAKYYPNYSKEDLVK